MRGLRVTAALLVTLGAALVSARAGATPKATCIAASEQGQALRNQHRLRDARAELARCADDACPAAIRKDCAALLDEVERDIPSVILRVRRADGRADGDLEAASVILDATVQVALDGTAIELDPGAHVFRIVAADMDPKEIRIVAAQAERRRVIVVDLEPAPKPAATAPPTPEPVSPPPLAPEPVPAPVPQASPVPLPVLVLGGLGVAGLAGFTYFGALAIRQHAALESCAPNCRPDALDTMRTEALVADVSLGIGLAAAAAATWLFLTSPQSAGGSARRPGPAHELEGQVAVSPVQGGAVGGLRGRF